MKHSLKTTNRWSSLMLAMGIASIPAYQSQAAIYWPGGTDDTTSTNTDYETGYNAAQDDCRLTPIGCGVKIYPMTKDQGYGETEPNDHIRNADGLLLGRFYHANTLGNFDEDWYYVVTDQPNQQLAVYFLADAGDFTNTGGWIIQVRDLNGNIIASFDTGSTSSGGTGGTDTGGTGGTDTGGTGGTDTGGTGGTDTGGTGGTADASTNQSPVDSAIVTKVTLGNVGTYYISVKSQTDGSGALRGYNIAANLRNTGQITPYPGDNSFDTETEPNDSRADADILRSNVIMSGVFDRTLVKTWIPPKPAEYETAYFYKLCDPKNISTIPSGLTDCSCDLAASPFPPNPNFNPNTPNVVFDIDPVTPGVQLPADLNFDPNYLCPAPVNLTLSTDPHYCDWSKADVDAIPLPLNVPVTPSNLPNLPNGVMPITSTVNNPPGPTNNNPAWPSNYQLSATDSCEAQQVQVAGTGTDSGKWVGGFAYDPDTYMYPSDGNEQLRLQICVRSACEFSKVHVNVRRLNSGQLVGNSTVIMDGPIEPGQTVDLGAAWAGDYYITFTAEPADGPKVDAATGQETVIDLTGPYDLLLMSTKFSPTSP